MKRLILWAFILFMSASAIIAQNKEVSKITGIIPYDNNYHQGSVLLAYNPTTHKFYAVQSDTLGRLTLSSFSLDSTALAKLDSVYEAQIRGNDTSKVKFDLLLAKHFATYDRQDSALAYYSKMLDSMHVANLRLQEQIDTMKSIMGNWVTLLSRDSTFYRKVVHIDNDSTSLSRKQIIVENGDVTETNSSATKDSIAVLNNLLRELKASSNSYGEEHTTVAALDSVVFGFNTKIITFINDATSSDTLYVSTNSSFPMTNTIKRIGGEGFTKEWNTSKLYFKIGYTPQASKVIRIEAN